jgi:type I restriction enzyme, S subunit
MANDWKIVRFEEIKAELKNAFSMGPFGSKIKAENFKLQGVPVLKGGNLSGIFINEDSFDYLDENKASELKASTAVRGDIVITHRGTLGQVGIIPHSSKYEKYIVSQSQLKLSFNRELVDPSFIYYFLKSPEGQSKLLANKSQVGVPAIAQALTSVKSIEINLPGLAEQKRIAEFLINLDYFMLNLMKTNQTLELLAETLFKSWFVNFDPVHAKAAGHEPEGVSAEIATLFPSEFEESELGLVPKGWSVLPASSVCSVSIGKTPPRKESQWFSQKNSDIKWLSIKDMGTSGLVICDTSEYLTSDAVKKFNVKLVPPRTPFFSFKLTVGRVGISDESMCTNEAIAHFICDKDIATYPFVTCQLFEQGKKAVDSTSSIGVATNSKLLKELPFLVPDKYLMEAFSALTTPIFESIMNNARTIQTISDIRDALLPRLISGKIRIEEAEEVLADVMPSTEKQVA